MLAKAEKDNNILMQLINHHEKMVEAVKNKVSGYSNVKFVY
jgi:hypothetical protein